MALQNASADLVWQVTRITDAGIRKQRGFKRSCTFNKRSMAGLHSKRFSVCNNTGSAVVVQRTDKKGVRKTFMLKQRNGSKTVNTVISNVTKKSDAQLERCLAAAGQTGMIPLAKERVAKLRSAANKASALRK